MPKRIFKIISIFLCLVIALCNLQSIALATNKGKIIVIGAHPDFGVVINGSEYSGFAYEYLKEIGKRTGHRYSYIKGSPDELFKMLEDGRIDVIPCVGNSDIQHYIDSGTSSLTPALSNYTLTLKFSGIYVKDDSNIDFFNIQTLNKAKIGYMLDNSSKYFKDGAFVCGEVQDAHFIGYATYAQMMNDLNEGKLDAVAKECMRAGANESIVYQFYTEPCYFLAKESNKILISQLDSEVGAIYMCNPHFAAELYDGNISMYGAQKYAYSDIEKQFIKDHPTIKIAYNLQASSTELYDNTSKRLSGATGAMFAELELLTGFKFEIIGCETLSDCIKLLDLGQVDAICGGVNNQSLSSYGNYMVSSPYLKTPIAIVGKENLLLNEHPKIAVPFNSDDISAHMKQRYPGATFLPYETVQQCLNAAADGFVDIACANAYEAAELLKEDNYGIYVIDVCSIYHAECLAYSETCNPALISVFGKSLAQVNYYDEIMSNFSDITANSHTTNSYWIPAQEMILIIIAIVVVLLIISIVIIAIVHNRGKRAAGIDTITGGRTKKKMIDDSEKLFKKHHPEKYAMVLFDINKFKFVNDRLGFAEGDKMLARVYKTLDDNMENGEICCRISDDNFACIIENSTDSEISARLNSIFAEFDRRNSIFVKYPVDFSAGVCRLGQCSKRAGSRLIDINVALDRCTIAKKTLKKDKRGSSIAFYDGKIRDQALREKDYETIMPTALEEKEFECYLQPKYSLRTRHIEGAEALIRWNSKDFGFVFPNEFIPLSEKNGFVIELDFYILEEVCRMMRRWIDDGKKPIVVSVNQSRLHLNHDDYIWRLREIVDKYDIPYEYIELELTESVFMENTDVLLTVMHKLHEIGFKLSLDDFGSGYSSLNMLKDIPVDVVKIDREFFNGTVNSEKGRAVISTVVDLAKNLDMEVISEGVETKEQVDFLADIDCAMVQGYYFAKPMNRKDFEDLWERDKTLRAAERDREFNQQLARVQAKEKTTAASKEEQDED